MALNVQAVRGMNDLLPEDTSVWQQVETVLRQTLSSFGYACRWWNTPIFSAVPSAR